MKVCERCGCEIGTKDGENLCSYCDEAVTYYAKKKANAERRLREAVMHDLGLVKVRGASGGTYWE